MKKEIRILFVEDVPADVVMINHELRKGGLSFRSKRVDSRDAFIHELQHDPPDLILSDHGLPTFDGFTALAIARDQCPDVPFIFVTNSLGEQMTIETFESGATDYVLKHNLSKLVPAVQRALRESAERASLRQKEQALRESEERFRMLVEGVKDYAIFMLDAEGRITSWNAGAQWLHGYCAEEVHGQSFGLFYTREDFERGRPDHDLKTAAAEGRFEEEGLRMGKGAKQFGASVVISALRDANGKLRGFAHVTRDISERLQVQQTLRRSEERYRSLVELCPDALLVVYTDGQIAFSNRAALELLAAPRPEQLLRRFISDIFPPDNGHQALEQIRRAREQGPLTPFVEGELIRLDGTRVEVEISAAPLIFQDKPAMQLIAHDITERKQIEEALRRSESRKSAILETALDAVVFFDHRCLIQEWNAAAQKTFGYSRQQAVGKDMAELIIPPGLRQAHREAWERYLATGEGHMVGERFDIVAQRAGGSQFPAELSIVRVPGSDPPLFAGFLRDIMERKQAEDALARSEARTRVILETALDAILSVDHQGTVHEWNPAAEKIFAYPRADALNRRLDNLIIPAWLLERYQDGLAHYLMTGVGSLLGRPIELNLRRADGREFQAELAITRVASEVPPRYTVFVRDITERKRAEAALRESEERFRLLVESVKDYAIYILDTEGRVATWNAGAERIEGYRAEEVIGRPFSIFFTPEDARRGVPQQALERAKAEGRALNEGWRMRKDGSRFWSEGIITALRDELGQHRGFSKVAHDVTDRKRVDEEIRQLNEQLEHRVRERTAQLEAANQELEAFSYSVSHDLRAPLRHIIGYVEILQSEVGDRLDPEARQHLQTIAASARQLGKLIDMLLAFSRMGRAELSQERFSMATIVEEARRELRREAEGRHVVWQIGSLPEIHGDPFMLRQAMLNLLSNALKYTRTRTQPVIEVGARVTEQETVFHVRDNGVGFDMQYAHKLFGVFQRLHRPSEFEGSGIGLASVRRIVHRHGGRTWAEGAVEGGATIYFSIPHPVKGESESS